MLGPVAAVASSAHDIKCEALTFISGGSKHEVHETKQGSRSQ